MTSRREEKDQRRAERIAVEEHAARAERRKRTLGIAAGALLGAAAVAAVVIALTVGGGGGGGSTPKDPIGSTVPKVSIPPVRATDLKAAAAAAGCRVRSFTPGPNDREHLTDPNASYPYKQNPPVFGKHYEIPAHDGDYVGQGSPHTEWLVHALEHGRVITWYRPAIGQRRIGQLETLFSEPFNGQPPGYKQILVQRPNMPFAVAASAWGHQLGCPTFNDKVFDALRAFRATYVDKAPENIPFPE